MNEASSIEENEKRVKHKLYKTPDTAQSDKKLSLKDLSFGSIFKFYSCNF